MLEINGRTFRVNRVNLESGSVNFRDITFANAAGFPIFREEPISFVRRIMKEAAPPLPAAVPAPQNFRITDDTLGHGGQKTKYGFNVDAIRTLKQIEAEGRGATPEEQEILSKYVGWGGIPQAFDERNSSWTDEYQELKGLIILS